MTQPTQLSSKVNSTTLDTMYNNFVKMTDWLIKGKASQHPMPAPYQALFDSAELVQAQQQTIQEQNNVIGGLQQRLAQADGRIAALETTLQAVNHTLTQLVEIANAQAQATPVPQTVAEPQPTPQPVAQPVQQPVPQAEPELVLADLGAVTAEAPQQQVQPVPQPTQAVSPNEQAIQVSATAVGAGNIDPASYAALDAEIDSLLNG